MACAKGCACWEHPGVSLLRPAPSLWLPNYGPSTSQELGQAKASAVTAARTVCVLLAAACSALRCREHRGFFSTLTRWLFDGQKPRNHYLLQLQQEMARVTSMQVVARGNMVPRDPAPTPQEGLSITRSRAALLGLRGLGVRLLSRQLRP